MSDETQSLDDVLNGVDSEPDANPDVEDKAEEQQEEATADSQEKQDSTAESEESDDDGQTQETDDSADKKDDTDWAKTAYMDEKRKRQELERQLEAERSAKQEQATPPDAIEDPEGYNQYMKSMVGEAEMRATLRVSRAMAKQSDPDFDAKLEKYDELFRAGEVDQNKILSSDSPYHAMLEFVDKHERMQKMENIDQWEAQKEAEIEERVRAKIESEMAEKASKDEKISNIKPSLASARSSGKATEENYDQSLNELLGR